ncbi:MAG: ATP-binding cassette domain-containing protein [Proteobacteria bacterium]|nr:ATP-binding cassette domain-containing protein [Pseudomonadota bacterium]
MIKFNNVTLRRGPNVLVEAASFSFANRHKVGLTGANGCGKSSLLAVILGQLEADAGSVHKPDDWVVAHVAQETPGSDIAAVEYALQGDAELMALNARIQTAEQEQDGALLGQLHAQLDAIDGYAAHSRASALLNGLGFKAGDINRPVDSFSGGWRMRLNLAQALMCRSDLLLLDEPTNHLDLDAVIWLQSWLERYEGTLILISHDRTFLDAVVNQVAHIEHGKLTVYAGNYSAFEVQRAAQLAQQQAAYEKQQREIHHMQDFVRRFKAKATKAKQAQSRVKMLERLELIAPAHVDSPFGFQFKKPEKTPGSLLTLEKVGAAYGSETIFAGVNLTILAGDRLGLIGPNGAGKSTLIKILAGDLGASGGEIGRAKDLRVGYFAQHQLEQLHAVHTPYQHLDELSLGFSEQQVYDHLGGFGFAYERTNETIAHFSGGEKARLVLALLVAQKPNLLLLDEPTNHLDLDMRHALAVALQGFEGALVTVSHDRFLLETVTDQFYLVADQQVSEFDGDLNDYRKWLDARRLESQSPTEPGKNKSRKGQRQARAAKREQLKPLLRAVAGLEKELERYSIESAALDEKLADSSLYDVSGKERLTKLMKEKGRVDNQLEEVEMLWLEAGEALEAAQEV